MKSSLFALILVAGLGFATPKINGQETTAPLQPASHAKPDWSAWNGKWKPVKATLNGRQLPAAQLEPLELEIQNGKYQSTMAGATESGKLNVDTSGNVDVMIEQGPNAGKSVPGIYKFENGQLVICYAIKDERPADFVSNIDNQTLLIVYNKLPE